LSEELTTRQFLERRENELRERLASAEATVAKLQQEWEEARRALDAIAQPERNQSALLAPWMPGPGPLGPLTGLSPSPLGSSLLGSILTPDDLSIRNLVTSAFKGSRPFRMYGATTQEIRDFIKDNFGRDIDRASLSPTLSRMRDEGHLKGPDNSNKWRLGSD
jgi:hypothetical protein